MPQPAKSRPSRVTRRLRLVAVLFCLAAVFAIGGAGFRWLDRRSPLDRYVLTDVRRSNLAPTHTASGRLESSKRTIIQCELENISVGVSRNGPRMMSTGASTILTVIPEGSFVKKGDVLAVLDSSDYEEMLRLQQITVERAKSDKLQAELNLEVARLELREFTQGTLRETIEDFEGRVFLSRSDLERATDRLNWSRRMKDKGYIPASQVSADEFRHAQMALASVQQDSAFSLFKKFTAPKTVRVLEGTIKMAETVLRYEQLRCQRHIERLALLEKQVANCTIRAPHDGFVIYANNGDRSVFIEPGTPVRQKQHLFYLPDLHDMEVVALISQKIVDEIGPGMKARIQVEGASNQRIEGHVKSVAPIATFNWRTDVQYFEGIVKIDTPPVGLRPGMTAEVEIALPERENVLAVPSEAIRSEDGHDVCLVVREGALERREVTLGEVTRDLAEVTDGLAEGEHVVLNPTTEDLGDDNVEDPAMPTPHEPATAPAAGVIAAIR